jgi:DNA-binding NtrC family response regulator
VISASNGKEAVDIYAREQSNIGLVVLDLIMPQMGGEKCLEELLKINPHLKVIVSSGHSLDQKELDRLSTYAKGFVNKPYQIKEFMKVVRGVLAQEDPLGTQERRR